MDADLAALEKMEAEASSTPSNNKKRGRPSKKAEAKSSSKKPKTKA